MKIKQTLFLLTASFLTNLLLNSPVNAINLIYKDSPNSNFNTETDYYKNGQGADLFIDDLEKIDNPKRNSRFWRVLTSSFPDWKFYSSSYPIYGDFVVNEYTVCPPESFCGDTLESVGAKLELNYVPNEKAPNQPDPINGNLRWIQLVINNHSLEDGHSGGENVIDIDIDNSGNGTPYYDSISTTSNSYYFNDEPLRYDISENYDWKAFLFLAEDLGQDNRGRNRAKIYSGVSWGWHNKVGDSRYDNYECETFRGCDASGNSGGGGFNKRNGATKIPESTSALGLITLSAWGIVKVLKLRKNK